MRSREARHHGHSSARGESQQGLHSARSFVSASEHSVFWMQQELLARCSVMQFSLTGVMLQEMWSGSGGREEGQDVSGAGCLVPLSGAFVCRRAGYHFRRT